MANEINLRVGIDATQASVGANNFTQAGNNIIDSAGSIAKSILLIGSAIKILLSAMDFLKESSDLFAFQEKQERKLEAVLKATGFTAGFTASKLKEMASALQSQTAFGDEAIISAQSLLLTFKNIQGEIFQRTLPAMLDLSTILETDLKSSALQLGKALNDPILGVSALSRVGIQFTDQQKEMIKTLVESNRLFEAQDIILKEVESQVGGTAKAMKGTLDFALRDISNNSGDLKEVIASTFAPVLIQNIEQISSKIVEMNGFIVENKTVIMNFANSFNYYTKIALNDINYFATVTKDTFLFVANQIGQFFPLIWNGVLTGITKVVEVSLTGLEKIGNFVGFDNAGDYLEDFRKQTKETLDFFKTNEIEPVSLTDFLIKLTNEAKLNKEALDQIIKDYEVFNEKIKKEIDLGNSDVVGKITKDYGSGWNNFLTQTLGLTTDKLNGFKDNFTETILKSVQTGKSYFKDFFDFVVTELLRIQIRKQLVDPISDVINQLGKEIFSPLDVTKTIAKETIEQPVKSIKGSITVGKSAISESKTNVTVNNYSNSNIETRTNKQNGDIELIITSTMEKAFSNGSFDGSMSQFGVRRVGI
jgi:hypothetical protein